LYIKVQGTNDYIIQIEIRDALGQIVLSETAHDIFSPIDISNLTPGYYFITINFDGNEKNISFIKI
ncbi:MAG: T9SS type A sorting domain-containing protein, partial [Flavobacteriales bacterium]|nr:T9SS type A sorting domain-containing protein [Flavobacteriales bacterium]